MEVVKYEDSQVDRRIIKAVMEMGFEEMTPIQQSAIPVLLEGRDIIGQAQTGTGKTAAFGIPIIQNIDPDIEGVQGIILCPTRELAIQAANELRLFSKYISSIKVLPVYGGQDIDKQIRSLRNNVSIVVGTPGRVMDHMRRKTLKLDKIKMVVLDEADEMLNMGFREPIETILAQIPSEHQTALFSATMPRAIMDIVDMYQKDAVKIEVSKKELTIPLVKQYYYEVKKQNKEEVVARLLDYYNPKLSLIFCNTKKMVDDLTDNLKGRGYFAEGLHGDMSQAQRDKVMRGFRSGTVEILIATDVAARGIDVDDVEAVFNYDVPQDIEYYVHRIGRTGRAGKKGRSFTLVVGREIFRIREIEKICKTKIKSRVVPSPDDIKAIKSEKVLAKAVDTLKESDISLIIKYIEEKINDEDITAIELCAGFLKMHMGEELQEIPTESYFTEKKGRGGDRGGDGRSRYGNNRGGGSRDGGNRDGGNRSGSYGGNRSYKDGNSKDGNRSAKSGAYKSDSGKSKSDKGEYSKRKEGDKKPKDKVKKKW